MIFRIQIALLVLLFCSCTVLKGPLKTAPVSAAKKDSIVPAITNNSKIKLYNEVVTAAAVSDSGFIIVHKVDVKYLFQIPYSIIDRDILIVSRLIKAAADNRPANFFLGYAGDQVGTSVVRFCRGPNDKLFIRQTSYTDRSTDSSENGLYRSVQNSNLLPIVASFDIKAYTPDSSGLVIDVTEFLNADNDLLYFARAIKSVYGLGGGHNDKSYVASVVSLPINLEIRAVNTYTRLESLVTYEVNASFVLLPEDPMKVRYFDERVGYFGQEFFDFDAGRGAEKNIVITRWRLEPKPGDVEKYLAGQLVEPKKPIVYYIDPSTPRKWIPYLMQGVNDWQRAFEKAGFKNAIYAREAPADNPEWSLYDARHNAIIYKPSIVANASGPHIHDPRTGEILETHVNWYHNIQQLLQAWYMIQAGPVDARARKMVFSDSLMGELIRYVCAHEVGHTLGLQHNFGSSATVPVDSLRSKTYLKANSFCPSIMDYARFNYVAQPQDSIPIADIFPRIGIYDEWAIDWGYRWLPQVNNKSQEKEYMNRWIIDQLSKDKRYTYGEPYNQVVTDPRNQAEDVGDDAVKAGNYGIENLKRVMSGLIEWTGQADENYASLKEMHAQLVNQFHRYIMHVTANIGLYTWTHKKTGQTGPVVGFLPKQKQKNAVEFLQNQLFDTPRWLMNNEVFSRIGGFGPFLPTLLQTAVVNELLTYDLYMRMIYGLEIAPDSEKYSYEDLLVDLEKGIWKELNTNGPIDQFRRNLQKTYVLRLIELIDAGSNDQLQNANLYYKNRSDYTPLIRSRLRKIKDRISFSLSKYADGESKEHLKYMYGRLQQTLNDVTPTKSVTVPTSTQAITMFNESNEIDLIPCYLGNERNRILLRNQDCWKIPVFLKLY